MKKLTLVLTILFIGLLSACKLYEDSTFEELSLDDALFVKLELLDKHDEEIFTMSSDEFEELFNDTDIEITANDILVFESINNMFAKLEGKTVPLATVDFIDTVIEGNLQSEEHDSLVYLHTIYNELATEYNVLLNLDDPIGDFILLIENTSGKQLEQTEIDDLTVAYNLLNQLN